MAAEHTPLRVYAAAAVAVKTKRLHWVLQASHLQLQTDSLPPFHIYTHHTNADAQMVNSESLKQCNPETVMRPCVLYASTHLQTPLKSLRHKPSTTMHLQHVRHTNTRCSVSVQLYLRLIRHPTHTPPPQPGHKHTPAPLLTVATACKQVALSGPADPAVLRPRTHVHSFTPPAAATNTTCVKPRAQPT